MSEGARAGQETTGATPPSCFPFFYSLLKERPRDEGDEGVLGRGNGVVAVGVARDLVHVGDAVLGGVARAGCCSGGEKEEKVK